MQGIMQTNNDWTDDDGIWSERLTDGNECYLFITPDNPAEYIWDDENGYVFIRFGDIPYKVQSIDINWINKDKELEANVVSV